jgi:hypothetical protein
LLETEDSFYAIHKSHKGDGIAEQAPISSLGYPAGGMGAVTAGRMYAIGVVHPSSQMGHIFFYLRSFKIKRMQELSHFRLGCLILVMDSVDKYTIHI